MIKIKQIDVYSCLFQNQTKIVIKIKQINFILVNFELPAPVCVGIVIRGRVDLINLRKSLEIPTDSAKRGLMIPSDTQP